MQQQASIAFRLRWFGLPLLLSGITLIMLIVLSVRITGVKNHNLEVAIEGARNIFRMIVLTREWNASHAGVYVFVTEDTPPNPYLEHPQRDLELPDHRKLTMLNPAYMTRQIAELAQQDAQLHLQLHITSLNPIRPANQADAWETHALKQFEIGKAEIASVETLQNQQFLRYMAPLKVKQNCLNCHAKQGYKLGDLRGGISVSLPFATTEQAIQNEIHATLVSHGLTYLLLVVICCGLLELLARRWQALNDNIVTLESTRSELVENEKMASLGRLVAGFAHELNTPVGIAVGAISHADDTITTLMALLQQEEVTEQELTQQLEYLREGHTLALANLRRAADLVQRFKRTSIERGSPQKRVFLVREMLQDVLCTLQNTLKHSAVNIHIDCPDELKIFGTPGLFEQVLTNLITNSLTHAFEPGCLTGEIRIQIEKSSTQHLILNYYDNGKGMTADVQAHAFEPFFTTQRASGGSGLGLYVIYNIITQQMQGSISVSSSLGQGTHFYINCPIENATQPNEP